MDVTDFGTPVLMVDTFSQGNNARIVIEPKGREPVRTDRDYVVVLSDHTQEDPMRVLRNLKADAGYYNYGKRTLFDFFRDAERDGFAAAFKDRLEWGEMRMDPTDISDVTGATYTYLMNGAAPAPVLDGWTVNANCVRTPVLIVNAALVASVRPAALAASM